MTADLRDRSRLRPRTGGTLEITYDGATIWAREATAAPCPGRRPKASRSNCGASSMGSTRDILDRLLATCRSYRLADATHDLALLLIAFGSDGRHRSEIVRLRVEQLRVEQLSDE